MNRMSVVFGIAAIATAAEVRAADAVQWRNDFTAAAIEAQKQKKALFITISVEGCAPCKEMHRTALQDASVADLLNVRCIPLLLDGNKERERMNQWRVSAFPTTMIVGTSGAVKTQVLERVEGKMSASELRTALQRAIQRQAAAVAATPGKRSPDAEPASATTKQSEPRSDKQSPLKPPSPSEAEEVVKPAGFKTADSLAPPPEAPAVALGGNCPVCMIERAEMVVGKAAESAVYNGRKYLFASAKNKKLFLDAPNRYLPGASGDCVVTLVDQGKHIAGDTKFPAMYDGKVYFLADKQSRDKFLKDPEAYVNAKGEPRPPKSK